MRYNIIYSESSKDDLKNIYEYIAYKLLSPATAVGQVERIMQAIRSLENMPMCNPVYHDDPWKSKGVRFIPVDNYLVFYLPREEDSNISIIRIIYKGRDIKKQMNETLD